MSTTLKLCLLEQAIPVQLDFLLFAIDKVRPQGNDTLLPDEMLVETRRVFADLRRVLAGTPLQLADPVAPLTRGTLRPCLIEALELLVIYKEERRQREALRQKSERKTKALQERGANLSPLPFPDLR